MNNNNPESDLRSKKKRRKANRKKIASSQNSNPQPQQNHDDDDNDETTLSVVVSANGKRFLSSKDGDSFHKSLRDDYNGFTILSKPQIDSTFHLSSRSCLERLRDAGFYHYDIVMAGGKNLSRTFVKRTIVGEPGLTYKYLGLRLFCHPWSGDDSTPLLRDVGRMNKSMIQMTQTERRKQQSSTTTGSCEYNLTLINYMEPASQMELKTEEQYGMGKSSVSWHADSSLQENSCIGVYQLLPTQKRSTARWDWKIALRPSESTTTGVLPLVVDTESESAYFLLDEFNERFQHMVLAGSKTFRISSTHRVAVTTTDKYEYIKQRTSKALVAAKQEIQQKNDVSSWNVDIVLESQAVLTELEFEWIAQYWVQGAEYDRQHVYWQSRIRALEKAWNSLEKLTFTIVQAVLAVDDTRTTHCLLQGLVETLTTRQELRMKWEERRADKVYQHRVPRPYHPIDRPQFSTSQRRLPKNLTTIVQQVASKLGRSNKKKRKKKT